MNLELAVEVALALKALRQAQTDVENAQDALLIAKRDRNREARRDAEDALFYAKRKVFHAEEEADKVLAKLA